MRRIFAVVALGLAVSVAFARANAAEGPQQAQMERFWQDYQNASNGFHDPDIAGTFRKGGTNFILFAQKADAILAAAAKGEYSSVDALQKDAGTLVGWMVLQRNVLASTLDQAIRSDADRVKAAPAADRDGLKAQEAAQEQADTDLLRNLLTVVDGTNRAFAAAEAALAKKRAD